MIKYCSYNDQPAIHRIVNAAAEAYRGIIPDDCWEEPYMPMEELADEMAAGVRFLGDFEDDTVLGVMGRQPVKDVILIRHAYVDPAVQRRGVGARLISAIREEATAPLLVGTWAAAIWAIGFYEKHGFRLVGPDEKDRLLNTYWTISPRQIETSVVLADAAWRGASSSRNSPSSSDSAK